VLLLGVLACAGSVAEESGPLVLEATIPLGDIRGRIDHLAIDLPRKRLFVAELGNDSVGVVDLGANRLLRTLTGFDEPQGVGYSQAADELYVTSAGDGTVRLFGGDALIPHGQIALGDDADNVRVMEQPAQVLVGYGRGALAVFDATSHARKPDIRLKGHPESFQILPGSARALVNIPETSEVAVVDLLKGAQVASWSLGTLHGNFPMAIDAESHTAWIVMRQPPRLVGLDTQTGARRAVLESCEDADDVFVDSRRKRLYLSCGSGHIDVWAIQQSPFLKLAHLPTRSGARTALFVPELDRLFLAVRAGSGTPAAIEVYRPSSH
jgi:hypothetical protein